LSDPTWKGGIGVDAKAFERGRVKFSGRGTMAGGQKKLCGGQDTIRRILESRLGGGPYQGKKKLSGGGTKFEPCMTTESWK